MPIDDFIIAIFCLVEDELNKVLQGKKLRQRGRVPNLTNGEVITMETVYLRMLESHDEKTLDRVR
ncbi:MAG: hypothetical protein WB791_05635 [Waddliaceae bacterium]